jgi:hypothetical protein
VCRLEYGWKYSHLIRCGNRSVHLRSLIFIGLVFSEKVLFSNNEVLLGFKYDCGAGSVVRVSSVERLAGLSLHMRGNR